MMYCSNCGAKIEEGSKFCTNCGVSLSAQKQPAMHEAPQKPSQPQIKLELPNESQPSQQAMKPRGGLCSRGKHTDDSSCKYASAA